MYKKLVLVLFMALFLNEMAVAQSHLVVYPAPKEVVQNKDFSVSVRKIGGEWHRLATYSVGVAAVKDTKKRVEQASMAYFDFEGRVEVAVKSNRGKIENGRVRPLSYQIPVEIKDSVMTFILQKPMNLSVEVNGDIFHNLHLFANPIDDFKYNKRKDKQVIYFAPGIHQLPGDTLQVGSGQTVYIAGGAIVRGSIKMNGVHDVCVRGRGIVFNPSDRLGIQTARSKRVKIEGVITTTCPTGESDSVAIQNVKAISHHQWGDGMNVFASRNVLFDGVFCRNSDDCTTVYASRLGYKGGCSNIVMKNSTLWADVAHPIFIGLHGNAEHPDTIENVCYQNIDILDQNEKQIDYQGCLAINVGDNNLVRNVRFEDIHIEDIREGRLIDLRVSWNQKYCTAPGRGIENVTYKNVSYKGTNAAYSIIVGYDNERAIKNIRFENLQINGVTIWDEMPEKPKWYKTADFARFFVGEHVKGISFECKDK